jgi:hypothetical protein
MFPGMFPGMFDVRGSSLPQKGRSPEFWTLMDTYPFHVSSPNIPNDCRGIEHMDT